MCAQAHHERGARSPLYGQIYRALKRALEALGFQMLSRAIWALFLNVLIQKWDTKNIVDQNLGERAPVAPPLDPPLGLLGIVRHNYEKGSLSASAKTPSDLVQCSRRNVIGTFVGYNYVISPFHLSFDRRETNIAQ